MIGRHVMIDLETLSTAPTAVVLSIGAVEFADNHVLRFVGANLRISEQVQAGLSVDDDVFRWWLQQSDAARDALSESEPLSPVSALRLIADEMKLWDDTTRVWANPASFDIAILENMHRAFGQEVPWKHWNIRDYRTVKNLFPEIQPSSKKIGVSHCAVDDAAYQAQHLIDIIQQNNCGLELR